jgi:hypothetical protein
MSMTPPSRAQGARARVTKKAKKDTPKAAEARLPGFSIMTKDGIDVTNSAGRGTKTKEQREHAHLMRIMKACDACKKKKIRVGIPFPLFAEMVLIMAIVRSFSSKITQRHVAHCIHLYTTDFLLWHSLDPTIISRNHPYEQRPLLQSLESNRRFCTLP